MYILNMMVAFNDAAYDEELSNLTVQGALDAINAGTIDIGDGTGTLSDDDPGYETLPYIVGEQPDGPAYQNLPYVFDPNDTRPAYVNLDGSTPDALRDRQVDTGELDTSTVAFMSTPEEDNALPTQTDAPDADPPSAEDASLPETAISTPDNEANTTDTPAAVLNRHHATGGDSIPVRMDNGTHNLLVNAEGQAVGYLHYNEETGLVHHRVVDSENPLPAEIENLFIDAENPEISYAEPAVEEAVAEAPSNTEEATEDLAADQTQGLIGPAF